MVTQTMPKRRVGSLLCAGTALIGVCYGFARFAYGLFAPIFEAEFALSPALVGAIGAGSYVGYCVAIIVSFALTNRFGARVVALGAGLTATIGTLVVALAPTGPVLAAGVLLAGSSTGLASPPMAAAIARWLRADLQDRAQSVVNAGTGIGVLLSGPIAVALLGDWRLAWGSFSVIAAVVTGWTWLSVPAGTGDRAVAGASGLFPGGAVRLLLAALLMGMTSSAVWTFGRTIVTTLGQAGPTASALMWTTIGVAGLLGAFSGHLTERMGLPRSWTLAMVLLAAATTVLAWGPGVMPAVYFGAAMFGGSYIILCGLILVWSTRIYPASPATGVGTSFLMIALGQAIGAPAVGAVVGTIGYPLTFLLCAALGLLGAAVRPATAMRSPLTQSVRQTELA